VTGSMAEAEKCRSDRARKVPLNQYQVSSALRSKSSFLRSLAGFWTLMLLMLASAHRLGSSKDICRHVRAGIAHEFVPLLPFRALLRAMDGGLARQPDPCRNNS